VSTTTGKRTAIVAAVVAGAITLTAGGAFATKAASNQFASATISKLGGDDPQAVLDKIAERVVKQLTSKKGAINAASKSLTDKLGSKLAGIDAESVIDQVSDEVVAAGMSKLDGISTDAIVEQVTNALVQQALAKIEALNLEALARSTLDGAAKELINSVDLEKIVKDYLAQLDVEAIVSKVVKDEMGSGGGGLFGFLFR
jgi:uncharacterized membrane protein YheB (UPF0754 family)